MKKVNDWKFYRNLIGDKSYITVGYPDYSKGNDEYYFYINDDIYNMRRHRYSQNSLWILSKNEVSNHGYIRVAKHVKSYDEDKRQYIIDIMQMEDLL